jgi:hypothetical protein
MDSRHFPLPTVAHKVGNDAYRLTHLQIASDGGGQKATRYPVIPDLASKRSEAESVGNPCLDGTRSGFSQTIVAIISDRR